MVEQGYYVKSTGSQLVTFRLGWSEAFAINKDVSAVICLPCGTLINDARVATHCHLNRSVHTEWSAKQNTHTGKSFDWWNDRIQQEVKEAASEAGVSSIVGELSMDALNKHTTDTSLYCAVEGLPVVQGHTCLWPGCSYTVASERAMENHQ